MNTVICTIEDDLSNHMPEGLVNLIIFLTGKLGEIPEEFRDSAMVNIKAVEDYGGHIVDGTITYRRPETEEERNEREADAASRREAAEARELEQFTRLKAKFEPTPEVELPELE